VVLLTARERQTGEDGGVDRPKLIATDMDGTLLNSDGAVSPRTAAALARVQAEGVPVVVVTGRPPRWLDVLHETLSEGLAVCGNGAVTFDLATHATVEEHLLEPPLLHELVGKVREEVPDIAFALEYGDELHHEAGYRAGGDAALPGIVEGSLERFLDRPAVKLLGQVREWDPDDLVRVTRKAVGDLASVTHSSHSGVVEISAPGVTKGTGLAAVAHQCGVAAADIVAFGDMPNDLPMLSWVGRAVAMANAHPDVREVADEVTVSNDEDGVAAVLERWF
jgi:Cof subfamily protein (haloacid dehalogenase superfamily)